MPSKDIITLAFAFLGASITNAAIAPLYESQTLKWRACPASLGFLQHTIECAEVYVPLDYTHADGTENVTIGVTRLPALSPKKRIGNLFYNPGGPGDAASQALNGSAILIKGSGWHREIREKFDLIGVDYRGTGLSSPILYDQDLFFQRVSELPSNGNDFEALRAKNVALRESAIELTGTRLIDYMDTATVAKDHEIVRCALGNEKLSWLGQSGGTQLGQRYAELFPNNIRAMIWDAVVAPSQAGLPGFIENALSEDAVMRQFFEWCELQNKTTCPLAYQNQTADAIWELLIARAKDTPIPAAQCTPAICVNNNVTWTELLNVARNSLYKPYALNGFAFLAAGIYGIASHNDASGAATPIPDKSLPPYITALNYATNVIECNDRINDDTLVSMRAKYLEADTSTPLFRGITSEAAFESACVGWPTLGRNPPHETDIQFSNTTMPVVLMVSNLYDPATPYSWGSKVQQEVGDSNTRRVTRKATGHTVYFQPEAYGGETVAAMVSSQFHRR